MKDECLENHVAPDEPTCRHDSAAPGENPDEATGLFRFNPHDSCDSGIPPGNAKVEYPQECNPYRDAQRHVP